MPSPSIQRTSTPPLARPLQAARTLEASRRPPSAARKRVTWLEAQQLLDVMSGHVLETRIRELLAVEADTLNAIYRPTGIEVPDELAVDKQFPVVTVEEEQGQPGRPGPERHDRRPGTGTFPVRPKGVRDVVHGGRLEEHRKRQLQPEDALDLREQLHGEKR